PGGARGGEGPCAPPPPGDAGRPLSIRAAPVALVTGVGVAYQQPHRSPTSCVLGSGMRPTLDPTHRRQSGSPTGLPRSKFTKSPPRNPSEDNPPEGWSWPFGRVSSVGSGSVDRGGGDPRRGPAARP